MRLITDPALRFAIRVYLPLRVGLSTVAAVVRALYRGDLSPDPILRPYLGISPIEGDWRDWASAVCGGIVCSFILRWPCPSFSAGSLRSGDGWDERA
jgi:hypothetical protein